jgi:hypothetical protein
VHVYAISVMVPWFVSIAYNAVMCSLPRFYSNEGMQPDSGVCFFQVQNQDCWISGPSAIKVVQNKLIPIAVWIFSQMYDWNIYRGGLLVFIEQVRLPKIPIKYCFAILNIHHRLLLQLAME